VLYYFVWRKRSPKQTSYEPAAEPIVETKEVGKEKEKENEVNTL